ncbi:hypothetical protein GW17_00057895 [Ensete ventricosum]|nr:hypothetical protein GW17_00057895 [Ensete ventricosum]RZS17149.1 hypothetical protein BHM03_00049263 [Ensete ventricosum]
MATANPLAGATGCSQGPNEKGRPTTARASPQGGGARPRPDRRGSRPRVAGCSAVPVRGGSRPQPCRRGCCQRSAHGLQWPTCKGRPTASSTPVGRQPGGRGTAGRAVPMEVSSAGVAAPWQSGCQRSRAVVAYIGAAATAATQCG